MSEFVEIYVKNSFSFIFALMLFGLSYQQYGWLENNGDALFFAE